MTSTSTFSNLEDTAIGIDLGTTYCAIGVCINGKVEIVPNHAEGLQLFPSYVCYPKKGGEKYGNAAKQQAYRNPETTIFDAKRIIGRSWDDPILQKDIAIWPFEVVKTGDSPKIKTGTKTRYPQEISAKLLTIFRQRAEKHLQKPVGSIKKAVITVPAYFNESQRRATIEAGETAGLQVLTILNEPTAAAIAYKLQTPTDKNETKTVLIYDLGGGTFDVAIVRVSKDALITLGVDGDTHLGGQDFDNLLMEYFCKRFQQKTKVNLLEKGNPEYKTPLARLRQQCEITKNTLSASEDTFIEVQNILGDHDLSDTLNRKEFENLIENLIDKSIKIVERAIKDARDIQSKNDIDEIILIGGSTRIPLVQRKLETFFQGKRLNYKIHPDEAVAYGAALQASILNDPKKQRVPLIIQDVTPKSLGCVSEGGKFKVIIKKNSSVPCSNSVTFKTMWDNQTSTTIEVFQGENEIARKNEKVGVFILHGIPPKPKGQEAGKILMEINKNGILSVTGTLNSTGSSSGITIDDKRMKMD